MPEKASTECTAPQSEPAVPDRILAQALAGDPMAFRTLVIEHSPAMYRLAVRLTADADLAEDVVQDAFVKAHAKLDTFAGQSSLATWLHRITVNTAMDALRKAQTRRRCEHDAIEHPLPAYGEPAVEHSTTSADFQRHAQAAFAQLTDLERAAFTLRHYEGHSIAEAAELLDLNGNACKQAIFRAVRKLRVAFAPLVTT